MTEAELIAKQKIEIEELKLSNDAARAALGNIESYLIGIGGPLNDNKHGYNKDQLFIFWRIEELCKDILG